MTDLTDNVHPIRPGGGLRRLRQGDGPRRLDTSATVLTKNQFTTALQAEIERALADEHTVLVMRVRHRAVPGADEATLRTRSLPPEVVDRIRSCNENIRVTLPGATEMMLFTPSLRRRADGEELISRLVAELSPPVMIDGLAHHLAPAIGAAFLDHDNPSVEMLVDGARLALDECDPIHRAMVFHPYQRIRRQRRLDMEVDLRRAVLSDQIAFALQPAFDLRTGALVAFEAFARWNRIDEGPVPAVEFIQIAKETGLGHLIDRQVLRGALSVVSNCVAADGYGQLTLWLNVSSEEIVHPEFVDTVTGAATADPMVRIGLELSPSPPVEARDVHEILKALSAAGVTVAVADFGIGNANLTVLERLPFDAVKLDRALIRQLPGTGSAVEVVKALIGIAAAHGLETTAQRVENDAQAALLTDLGCRIGQGYHFAEPSTDVGALRAHLLRR